MMPSWIPIVSGTEDVLYQNGWSFLDPDDSEAMSAYDIYAANEEGLYKPHWGGQQQPFSSLVSSLSSPSSFMYQGQFIFLDGSRIGKHCHHHHFYRHYYHI